MSFNLYKDLIKEGLAANIPATPDQSDFRQFYYATDTFVLSLWSPAAKAWVAVSAMADNTGSSTVAALPANPVKGQFAFVTDATTPAVGSTVAGSGAVHAYVVYDGTNWKVVSWNAAS